MSRRVLPVQRWSRRYFGLQAVAGAAWWVAVFASSDVQRWTLGGWPPGWLVGPDAALFVGGSLVVATSGSVLAAGVTVAWTVAVTGALVAYGLATGNAGWGVLLMALSSTGTLVAAGVLRYGEVPFRWFFVGPFRFRPAPARTPAGQLAHSLAQLVVFWSLFLVGLPLALGWGERRLRLDWPALADPAWTWCGRAVFVAGSALGLWSCITMATRGDGTPLPAATARELVVAGPYRIVRNPMALAGAVQTIGVGLWVGSWLVVASAVAGGVAWHTLIRPEEEADLATRFGATYERYRQAVRCWLPALRGAQRIDG